LVACVDVVKAAAFEAQDKQDRRTPNCYGSIDGIHAVREALEAGRAFDRIVIARGGRIRGWKKL